ncbi:PREDICTED: uncharacterized protein LOC103335769 [Prunus mume]|uniref:Uncharacterized protein LOC103335769 n=1 Tax=Prunus mume TaxID=102107 RepID=A0ABM1LSU9_PRUMU|nr:PREDICTED: uncharacterized protein LOC103335769 [Prunus mume]
MERSLADILREERQIGHKGDGDWKAIAYNTAAAILSAQFDIKVSADNIRNRVKTWKRFYGIVSDILSQSGFNWDATKKMISVDEDNVWDEYVKSHEDARTFRFKVIANWDDIVDLCGKDRATGEGAETCAEDAEVMTLESDPNNIVDLESDTQGFESCQVDHVSPSSSCPKRRNQNPSDIPPPKKKVQLIFLLIQWLRWLHLWNTLSILQHKSLIQHKYIMKSLQFQILVQMNN